jgi:hypothetical protein
MSCTRYSPLSLSGSTSVTCVILREPSATRSKQTTMWTALAVCARTATSGNSTLLIRHKVSRRRNAPVGKLACVVAIDPLWPVFIACNSDMHSLMVSLSNHAHLAHHDAVGPQAQRAVEQIRQRHLAHAVLVVPVPRTNGHTLQRNIIVQH